MAKKSALGVKKIVEGGPKKIEEKPAGKKGKK
jgi:hypothetical protein